MKLLKNEDSTDDNDDVVFEKINEFQYVECQE